jgi:class 3 adenylate cyclase
MKEKYENVTIIFCDIYDFDKLIAHENKRVVHVLDSLFRAFDSLCQTHGVQKIEVELFFFPYLFNLSFLLFNGN